MGSSFGGHHLIHPKRHETWAQSRGWENEERQGVAGGKESLGRRHQLSPARHPWVWDHLTST